MITSRSISVLHQLPLINSTPETLYNSENTAEIN